jgi:hypothetical protein
MLADSPGAPLRLFVYQASGGLCRAVERRCMVAASLQWFKAVEEANGVE